MESPYLIELLKAFIAFIVFIVKGFYVSGHHPQARPPPLKF